ncbi:MAG: GWxTD domain-containing protein [Chlorobi bacterium]|nr:GWxTD domain-containing protein [Chlorobiota bacterium]
MAIPGSQAQKLNAFLSYTVFNSPESGPYIETYLAVDGKTVRFIKNENNKFIGSVQIIMIFKKGEEIVNFDKYELLSHELEDTTSINFDFLDQQRYSLTNGEYVFEIQISDINNDIEPFVSFHPINIEFPEDKISISGIELIKTYVKTETENTLSRNGYDITPHISNFYAEDDNTLTYYAEIYNTDKLLGKDSKYLLTSYIQKVDNAKKLSKYVKYKKENTKPVNILFNEFNITNLESGNYLLVIEARDKENNLIGLNKMYFQRSNPRIKITIEDLAKVNVENSFASRITNIDTLREYVHYLEPISSNQEVGFAMLNMRTADLETMQKFFYQFWYERNNLEPEREWEKYLDKVNQINLAYATQISKGYETDRGRVYLKYGPPNAISESYNEPAAYPYEIWHYYVLENGERDRKFVFYTKDIVTNDFTLLHSDVTGEYSNYRWQYYLYQRVDPGFNIDQRTTPDTWGGNSKRYFDIPR